MANILGVAVAKVTLSGCMQPLSFSDFCPNVPGRCETEEEVASLLHPPADLQNLDTRQGNELLPQYIRIVSWNLKHLKLKQNSYRTGEHLKH